MKAASLIATPRSPTGPVARSSFLMRHGDHHNLRLAGAIKQGERKPRKKKAARARLSPGITGRRFNDLPNRAIDLLSESERTQRTPLLVPRASVPEFIARAAESPPTRLLRRRPQVPDRGIR